MRERDDDPGREACLAMSRSCLSWNLRKTERIVTRHYDAYLADAGVTAVQLPMLATIASAPEPSFRFLSEQLDLDRSTLSRNLNLLQRMGLVKIGPSSGPKPGPISLTRKGRDTLRRAHERWLAAQREIEKVLNADDLSSGMGFLRNLRRGARSV